VLGGRRDDMVSCPVSKHGRAIPEGSNREGDFRWNPYGLGHGHDMAAISTQCPEGISCYQIFFEGTCAENRMFHGKNMNGFL